MNVIHIFTTSDKNYGIPLCVMITSVLYNKSIADNIEFHVLDFGILYEDKANINAVVNKYNAKVHYYEEHSLDLTNYNVLVEKLYKKYDVTSYINPNTFVRLLIWEQFPNLDKCLWLDADLVVNQSLANLWAVDVTNTLFAGVLDLCIFEDFEDVIDTDSISYVKLCKQQKNIYMNAGVLLLNLQELRKLGSLKDILNNLYNYIDANNIKLTYYDQDILNIICKENIIELPIHYNLVNWYFNKQCTQYNSEDLQTARANIQTSGILHYTGSNKPWLFKSKIIYKPFFQVYWFYLSLTPYKKLKHLYAYKASLHRVISRFANKNTKKIKWLKLIILLPFSPILFILYLFSSYKIINT